MKTSELRAIIQEEIAALTTEAVPSNIQQFANRKGAAAKRLVRQVDGWANKIGKRIVGGTAVGKNYSTLILDLTHQGGEISIDLDEETIEVQGEPVESFKEFEMAVMNLTNEAIVKEASIHSAGDILVHDRTGEEVVFQSHISPIKMAVKDAKGKQLIVSPMYYTLKEAIVTEAVEYVDKDSPESKIVVRGFGNYITLMQTDFDDKKTTTFVVGTQQIAELIKVLNKFK